MIRTSLRSAALLVTSLALSGLGCLSSEMYRRQAGEALCDWTYRCSDAGVTSPLEATYDFRDAETCADWFEAVGHIVYDGEEVVGDMEQRQDCTLDQTAARDLLDEIESAACEGLDLHTWVMTAESVFGEPYRDCPSSSGGGTS